MTAHLVGRESPADPDSWRDEMGVVKFARFVGNLRADFFLPWVRILYMT
jgi:hypothetical protein